MLKKLFKWAAVLFGTIVLVVAGLGAWVALRWDRTWDVPLVHTSASTDPKIIARGEYLVYGPAHCAACHLGSWEEFGRYRAGEKVPLRGGHGFEMPLGKIYSRNLTPCTETGIGRYTDGQLARLLRWNVKPNGQASLEPAMPFGDMAEDDLVAIVSYLRASQPVRAAAPENQWNLLGKVVRTFAPAFKPRKAIHPIAVAPAEAPTKERGAYLARSVANCVGCHTKRNPMDFSAAGPEFAGGFEMEPAPVPGADKSLWFRTPNLTPQPEGALQKFPDRQTFVARFKNGGRQHEGSPMQWESFARMSDDDLGALYEFFKSLPPAPGPTGDPTFRRPG